MYVNSYSSRQSVASTLREVESLLGGRTEEGKINSDRVKKKGLMEQVAFKLDLEGWVGFQQADVRVGVG